MAKHWYYVCDSCGNLVTITAAPIPEGIDWTCDTCGSNAQWEFTDKEAALRHSLRIQDVNRSRLFRRVG